jgi:hypothetical protein
MGVSGMVLERMGARGYSTDPGHMRDSGANPCADVDFTKQAIVFIGLFSAQKVIELSRALWRVAFGRVTTGFFTKLSTENVGLSTGGGRRVEKRGSV